MSEAKKTLKIAHVVRRFVFAEWGGTESAVWNTVRNQRRLGLNPEILATAALAQVGEEFRDEVRIRRFSYFYPYFPMSRRTAAMLDKKGGNPFVPALFRALRQERFDLVHIHCGGRMAVMSALTAHRGNRPCVITLHGGHAAVPPEEIRQMMAPVRGKFHYGGVLDRLRKLRRDAVGAADAVICVSHEEAERLAARYPGRPIVYLPNGVNCADFQVKPPCSPRREWGIAAGRTLVLCISRIDYQKNQLILLNLLERDRQCHVLLVGPITAPGYCDRLRAEAARRKVAERLTIIPGLPPDDPRLKAILHEAELFVLPSLHEPFGIVALEAWAAGLPVLAARVGGLKDFIRSGHNGLLFAPDDPEELFQAYQKLTGDAALRARLAANAADAVRAFGWDALSLRLVNLYRELIDARS